MMNTDRDDSDFQIVPSKFNGRGGYWILVDSRGNCEVREKGLATIPVTYEELKQRMAELRESGNTELINDAQSILTFADMRRLEKST